jgi:hypothetical protein
MWQKNKKVPICEIMSFLCLRFKKKSKWRLILNLDQKGPFKCQCAGKVHKETIFVPKSVFEYARL